MPDVPRRAVALRYRAGEDAAPEVVATGAGHVADRIVELAVSAGVPVRDDPVLVEALRALDRGGMIPEELFGPVAEVLVWAVALDRRARGDAWGG